MDDQIGVDQHFTILLLIVQDILMEPKRLCTLGPSNLA